MFNRIRLRHLAAILAAGSAFALPLSAQTVGDGGVTPSSNLNLPSTFTTYGKVDPQLRKATVIINGEIITGTDVEHRLGLIKIANGGKIPEEEMERLRIQIFRNLIDEILQIQEAKANKIEITKDDIDQSFARVSQNLKRNPQQMNQYLAANGSSARTMRQQIHAEIAWSRLLRRKVEVNVSDAEVNAIMKRLEDAKGTTEYSVGEIYLSSTPERLEALYVPLREANGKASTRSSL